MPGNEVQDNQMPENTKIENKENIESETQEIVEADGQTKLDNVQAIADTKLSYQNQSLNKDTIEKNRQETTPEQREEKNLNPKAVLLQGENYNIQPQPQSIRILRDIQSKYSVTDMFLPKNQKRFRSSRKSRPYLGFSDAAWWVKIELSKANLQTPDPILIIPSPFLDQIEVYTLNKNKEITSQQRTGDTNLFEQRPILHRHFIFPIEFSGKLTTTLLVKLKSSGPITVALQLADKDYFYVNDHKHAMTQGIYFGAMVLLAIYSLIMYTWKSQLSYVLYTVFILTYGIFLFIQSGYGFQYIYPMYPEINDDILVLSLITSNISAILLSMSFLKLFEKRDPIYYFTATTASLLGIMTIFSTFIGLSISLRTIVFLSALVCVSILIAAIFRYLENKKEVRFFIGGWFLFFSVNLSLILANNGTIASDSSTTNSQLWIALLSMIGLAVALGERRQLLDQKNEKFRHHVQSKNIILKKQIIELESNLENIREESNQYLSHIKQGVCTISQPKLTIKPPYSLYMDMLFGEETIKMGNIIEILAMKSDLSHDELFKLESSLYNCIGAPESIFQMHTNELVKTAIITDQHGVHRILELSWKPVIDQRKTIDRFVLILKDVTHVRNLEAESIQNAIDMELMEQIRKIPIDEFQDFMDDLWVNCKENRKIVSRSAITQQNTAKQILTNLQTMNTSVNQYQLKQMTEMIREAEAFYISIVNNEIDWDEKLGLTALEAVENVMRLYDQTNEHKLGRHFKAKKDKLSA